MVVLTTDMANHYVNSKEYVIMRHKNMKMLLSVGTVIMLGIVFQIKSFNAENRNGLDSETDYTVSLSNITADSPNGLLTHSNEPGITQEHILGDNLKEKQQSYESSYNFPYSKGIEFADLYIFEILKTEYNNIDFYGDFKRKDKDNNSLYIDKYQILLSNEVTFLDKMQEKELYFRELEFVNYFIENKNYGLKDFSYIFYDVDEDDMPELCVSDGTVSGYIFKYIPDDDQFILWYKWESPYYGMLGGKKIYWDHNGDRHAFYKLDDNAEVEYEAYFHQHYSTNTETGQPETIYMISLPSYTDKPLEIAEEMKINSYFDENLQVYYFRVSEAQYDKLTHNYFEAMKTAQEKIKEVTYTYDELFSDLTQ